MHSSVERQKHCYSRKFKQERSHTILFNILNCKDSCPLEAEDQSIVMHSCNCEQWRFMCLRNPERTCQAASEVLLKTMCFIKSLPSFQHLPVWDQFLLLRSRWVPLYILGLAQERIAFKVVHFPTTSFLHKILVHHKNGDGEQETEDFPLNLAAVQNLKLSLDQLWRFDLSPKEYAYIKGTVLFDPEVPGLINHRAIEGLQNESQRLLHQVIHKLYPNEHSRWTSVLLTVSLLHTIEQNLMTALFFRRQIGQTNFLQLLTEMLFSTGRS